MREAAFTPIVFLSAELKGNTKLQNEINTATLKRYLKENDKSFGEYLSSYNNTKEINLGVLVANDNDVQFLQDIAKVYSQDSILYINESREGLLKFSNGQDERVGTLVNISKREALVTENYTNFDDKYWTFRG